MRRQTTTLIMKGSPVTFTLTGTADNPLYHDLTPLALK